MNKIEVRNYRRGMQLVLQIAFIVCLFAIGMPAIAFAQHTEAPHVFALHLRIANNSALTVLTDESPTRRSFGFAIKSGRSGFLRVSQSASGMRSQPLQAKSHSFFDGPNAGLFAGVGVIRLLDYTSTRYFRRRGIDEALLTNDIVDNKPLFAGIETAGTAASIGISYLFHRTGHHRLERWVSMIHVGVGTFGFIRNYNLAKNMPVIRD
jgi:hypothetical protein